jgi:signal transduction histidine kinase
MVKPTLRSAKQEPGFVRRLVHELRTPLASVRVMAELLAADPQRNLGARQLEKARSIERVATDLGELLAAVSELDAIAGGRAGVEPEAVVLAELAGALEEEYRPLAAARGLGFEVALADPPPSLQSDRQRLRQLLRLLLDHALGRPEAARVALHVSGASDPARAVTVAVRDDGRTVPEADRDSYFEPFGRARGPSEQGGRGRLALATARALSGLLGGELELAARDGGGNALVLTLPPDLGEG